MAVPPCTGPGGKEKVGTEPRWAVGRGTQACSTTPCLPVTDCETPPTHLFPCLQQGRGGPQGTRTPQPRFWAPSISCQPRAPSGYGYSPFWDESRCRPRSHSPWPPSCRESGNPSGPGLRGSLIPLLGQMLGTAPKSSLGTLQGHCSSHSPGTSHQPEGHRGH